MSLDNSAEVQAPTPWFSRSKTRAPRFSIPLVERKRLLLMLDTALDESLSCIVAPAGFGKSTLLSQWRDSLVARDIKCAWINLDENDREIRQFFAYLVFAIEDAGVSLGYLRKAAENGFVDMSSTAITTSLLSAIIDIEEHMVLILDDYHRPASDEIDDFVKTLSDQCGDRIHIAIGGRKPVDINLPEFLAAGRAIEIPASKLRFSDREVADAMGDDLDAEAVVALQEQVEGWPVAVQMARLFGRPADHRMVPKTGIAGAHGHLADYLVTNVLHSQSPELQDFLLETSILDGFNAELANAVCGHENSRSLIFQLQSLQALVIPLDDDLKWFRYHHLFADCLADLLRQENPEKFTELHRNAARWCGKNQMIAEAVNYANAIKDYDLSKQIINDNCEWMRAVQYGGVGYLNGLLADIPEEEIANDARMLFSKSNASMIAGDFKNSLNYNNAAEAIIEQQGITPETLRDRFGVGTGIEIRVEIGIDRNGGWLKERLDIVDALAEADPALYTVCGLMRTAFVVQKVGYGDFEIARDYAAAAEANLAKANNPITISYCQVSMGLIELWTNFLDDAQKHFQTAIKLAESFSGQHGNMKFVGDTLLRSTEYWQSDLDTVSSIDIETAVTNALDTDGWYDVYAIGFDAIVHNALVQQDHEKANKLVERLMRSTDRLAIERLKQFSELMALDCTVARMDMTEAVQLFNNICNWLNVDAKAAENMGWFHKSIAAFSCARYLKFAGRYDDAMVHVEKGLSEVNPINVILIRVRGNVLKASILEGAGKREKALAVLEGAIEDAAQINCPRPFAADISDTLLADAVSSVLQKTEAPAVKEFAGRLAVSGPQKMFSSREEEVLKGLAEGKSNKEIARELDVTDNTIKFHLRNIYRKLGVKKRVPAVEKARELGVL